MLVNDRQMCSFMSHDRLDALLAELQSAAKQGVK
jgi:NADH-quinone oxidoreductase subunit E